MNSDFIIENLDLSFVREKTTLYRDKESTNEFRHAELEFKKYLKLIRLSNGPLAIPSSRVDDIWHAFILFTPQYRKFCKKVYGHYIEHQPNTDTTPVPLSALSNFYSEYEQIFGKPDSIWTEDFNYETALMLKRAEIPENFSNEYRWSGWPGKTWK
uniref:Uncharacterized protein n=1 Tax=Candidatus Kentrum sp. LFY TaxID=2126342 RepID=A0A450U6P1_9GAMM|nr:MAG: hypothetical protein BECKLFY1418A_GA0070994_100177 [Candidatus Kentron sp. LFY]